MTGAVSDVSSPNSSTGMGSPINDDSSRNSKQQHVAIDLSTLPAAAAATATSLPAPTPPPRRRLQVLCITCDSLSIPLQFILLSAGVSICFMVISMLEEYLFRVLPGFTFGWFTTMFELISFAIFSLIERQVRGEPLLQRQVSLSSHTIVAVAMTASRGLTNWALSFLNYPTHIVFKSLKLFTVMLGSVLLLGKRYHAIEYVAVALLVSSAALFSLGDLEAAEGDQVDMKDNSMVGIVIVVLSLFADSLHSNTQEKVLKVQKAPESEVMLFSNSIAAVCTAGVTMIKGELIPAIIYCNLNPFAYLLLILRSIVVFLGVTCFVASIKHFGVLSATTVTTVRKVLSILMSFLLFPKPWLPKHALGLFIFVASVSLSLWHSKRQAAANERQQRLK